ncbi:MAG TPA: hypothetical protein VHG29_03625 [Novosphingobium sp.]|nr:hypothetical protein [Novosphingobium sp.]
MILALMLLAQIGPLVNPGPSTMPLPQARIERRASEKPAPAPFVPQSTGKLGQCLAAADANPTEAIDIAEAWAMTVKGTPRADPEECRGVALSRLLRWGEAETAFLGARDAAAASDKVLRARLGAMAGNAALAAGSPDRALTALDLAHADALTGSDARLGGDIALDRAQALVALQRPAEAATALAEVRNTNPTNALGWLLSATLSRRMSKLAEAQAQIEQAARLLPIDPEIGLEAGVIAVLSGRAEAARRSWQSVIAAAPDSPSARTAKTYLDQLGPAATVPR